MSSAGAGPASWALALVPPPLGVLVRRAGLTGGLWPALRLTELLTCRKSTFRELVDIASTVVAVSAWVRELLIRNGVPQGKIVLSRQGTDVVPLAAGQKSPLAGRPLRAVMLGRLDSTKGFDTLIEALALIPDLECEVDVYGIEQHGGVGETDRLRGLASRDRRIRMLPAFPSGEAAAVIRNYDVTLVPSKWMETGPLVVLESFAAGVPVIGSNLGGIPERIRHDVDGLLVESANPNAWAEALMRIVRDPQLLPRLASGIVAPKTMRQVAEEMRTIYASVLATSEPARPREAGAGTAP